MASLGTARAEGRPALFGKLPSHGDFVARGLDDTARKAWDAWISEGLTRARENLGAAFEAVHDAAPPWRFVLGPGPFGPGWRAGAIAPSIDAAGRRYAVVLVLEGLSDARAIGCGEALAAAAEGLIWDGFEGGWTADRFVEAAAEVGPEAVADGAATDRWWTLGGPDHAPRAVHGTPPDLWLHILLPPTPRAPS